MPQIETNQQLFDALVPRVFGKGVQYSLENSSIYPNKFYVIFNLGRPRWIFPEDSAYTKTILDQWAPFKTSSRLKWILLKIAYKYGLLGFLPKIKKLSITSSQTQDWSHLGLNSSSKIIPLVYVGTPSPTHKAVVFLSEKDTSAIYVAKVPLVAGAIPTIANETAILKSLSLSPYLILPKICSWNAEEGISLQTCLKGSPLTLQLSQRHIDFLLQLTTERQITLSEEITSVKKLLSNAQNSQAAKQVQILLEKLPAATLKSVVIHGDFAPWNLLAIDSSRITAIDWENARDSGLPFSDLAYFFLTISLLFHLNETGEVLEGRLDSFLHNPHTLKYMSEMRLSQNLVLPIMLLTAARLLAYHLSLGEKLELETGSTPVKYILNAIALLSKKLDVQE